MNIIYQGKTPKGEEFEIRYPKRGDARLMCNYKAIHNLEIVVLEMFASNSFAKEMYQKYGFVEYGNLPNGIKLKKSYIDRIYMYKNVR